MRRTYRSKKETSSALDPKEVLFSIDEKSSIFDAFYIQNIKQTKRELSCMGSSNQYSDASHKVRKKKYVKRIHKQTVKTPEKSFGQFTYLTPDRSIHLKKAPDLFDQLLNSSSTYSTSTISNNAVTYEHVLNKRPNKPYTNKKKAVKVKKINYSSSDTTDSDKENTKVEKSVNTTDINSHKLLIENDKVLQGNYDQSIMNIVKKFSLIHNFRRQNNISSSESLNDSPNTVFRLNNNRLTTNAQSPILGSCPLSSTPFTQKLRSKSIYNFSPIVMKKNDDSYGSETIQETKDNRKATLNNEEVPNEHLNNLSTNKIEYDSNKYTSTKNIDNQDVANSQITEIEPFLGFSNDTITGIDKVTRDLFVEKKPDYKSLIDFSSVEGTLPTQPFLGFTLTKVDLENDPNLDAEQSQDIFDSVSSTKSKTSSTYSLDSQDSDQNSLYDTCNSNRSSASFKMVKVPIVKIKRLSDSTFKSYLIKMPKLEIESDSSCEQISISDNKYNENDANNPVRILNQGAGSSNEEVIISSSDGAVDSNSNDEEELRNFVTTRRRNDVTNDSILILDNSFHSNSSSDYNNTVVSLKEKRKSKVSKNVYHNDLNESRTLNKVQMSNNLASSSVTVRRSSKLSRKSGVLESPLNKCEDYNPPIVLQPGKRWERSLSIYRRMTMTNDHFNHTLLDDEPLHAKGRKYRQSVISTMEMQENYDSLHNDSISSRRSTFVCKPSRPTIRIIKEPNSSRVSICSTLVNNDFREFLSEDCDDTVLELSKLSIADQDCEVTVIERIHDISSRINTARDFVLRRCNQSDAILFDECYPDSVLKNCQKIGEGVYGEVYLWRASDGVRVMKIIPIGGDTKVNGEQQKDFNEIITEIVIAMELSALRTPIEELERQLDEEKLDVNSIDAHDIGNATDIFNKVLAVRCVYGNYPSRLLDLWDLYDETKGSENDNPAILPPDQQYIVLELANAGQDLESYQFNSAEQAHALFLQLAYGLAVAEEAFQFEHRDLHWGNVLISPTEKKWAVFVVRGRAVRVGCAGVRGAVIDYSLSRASLAGAALYCDLQHDDALFAAAGDYQFDVYRRMRDKLGNEWQNFEPYTNILWLHYIIDKMITALRYKRTNTKIHKHYIAKLKGIKNRILNYGSTVQFVLTDNEL